MKVLLALECSETGSAAADAISDWAVENKADVHLFTVLHPKDIHETVGSSGYAHTTTPQGTPSGQLLSGLKDPQGRVAEDRTQALVAGFQAHLAKPAMPDVLLATAQRLLPVAV